MAESESEYHHGMMDVHAQQQAFKGFINGSKWGSLALASMLTFLVLWFCTPTGFFGGAVAGVLVAVIGFVVLKENKPSLH
jgi:hypothetical protein